MRTLEQWFEEYGKSHQNPNNKKIHYICVPLITYSTIGLLAGLSQYLQLPFSLAWVLVLLGGIFYFRLNIKLGFLLTGLCALAAYSFSFYPSTQALLTSQAIIFLVSWLFQFIGHKWEDAKPSFLEDLTFLLIGPLWVADKLSAGRLR